MRSWAFLSPSDRLLKARQANTVAQASPTAQTNTVAQASPTAQASAIAQVALLDHDINDPNGGRTQILFFTDGQLMNIPDLNRDFGGIRSVEVIPEGAEQFNRQNARCVFGSSQFGGVSDGLDPNGPGLCVSSNDAADEGELSENGLNG
ncbi:uncharacterized protein AB675_8913 [Cyphellophora attinorum]|uniref:Uncharacterized protein n=1 Tax=Cyphellophora attinorum TaxID=1664694 RepID=A0A0N1H3I9_9EURO|nr:uncharacterized protein AB675_8913 [Phialophora attinorum]KPI36182.1 hypothetical protein AB675_8913 [Phialophora attinorum]